MGSRYGVDETYIQRIMAAQISSTLRGFGYALSGPMDLDENEYPGTVNCFMFHVSFETPAMKHTLYKKIMN